MAESSAGPEPRTLTFLMPGEPHHAFLLCGLLQNSLSGLSFRFLPGYHEVDEVTEAMHAGACAACVAPFPAIAASGYEALPIGSVFSGSLGPLVAAPNPMLAQDLPGIPIGVDGLSSAGLLAAEIMANGPLVPVIMPHTSMLAALNNEEIQAGIVMFEGALMHLSLGLYNIADLGRWWTETFGHALPLSGIALHPGLPAAEKEEIAAAVRSSIQFSTENPAPALEYALTFGGGMDTESLDVLIRSYISPETYELSDSGRAAVHHFVEIVRQRGLLQNGRPISFWQNQAAQQ